MYSCFFVPENIEYKYNGFMSQLKSHIHVEDYNYSTLTYIHCILISCTFNPMCLVVIHQEKLLKFQYKLYVKLMVSWQFKELKVVCTCLFVIKACICIMHGLKLHKYTYVLYNYSKISFCRFVISIKSVKSYSMKYCTQ